MSAAAALRPEIDLATVYPLAQEEVLALPLGYRPEGWPAAPRIGVMLHAFHIDVLAEIAAYLAHLPFPADLFVTTDDAAKQAAIGAQFAAWPGGRMEIRLTPNRGRDVAPKLVGLGAMHAGYDFVLHLHTKRSSHESGLAGWRGYLLETLLGSPEVVLSVFEAFRQAPSLGMLAPQHIDQLRPWVRWGENFAAAAALARRMGFTPAHAAPLEFPSGSMFWARPEALRPLLDLGLSFEDFPEEARQTDGTLAHAIERLYYLACEQAGFGWMKITRPAMLRAPGAVQTVRNPAELRRLLRRAQRALLAEDAGHGETVADHPHIPFFPPRPKRLPYLPWRRLTGEGAPAPRASLRHLAGAGPAADGRAVAQAFADGADLIVLGERLLPHPGAFAALARMAAAADGCCLLEPALLPAPAPQIADAESLAVQAPSGLALALSRAAFAALGPIAGEASGSLLIRHLITAGERAGLALRLCPDAHVFPGAGARLLPPAEAPLLDLFILLEDETVSPLVERTVFTLLAQKAPLQLALHLLLIRFPQAARQALRARLAPLRPLNPAARIMLHHWDEPAPFDARSALLSLGLTAASGRYLLVLSPGDLLGPGALARLLGRLTAGDEAEVGGLLSQEPVLWWGESVVPQPAAELSLAPITLFDRRRIRPAPDRLLAEAASEAVRAPSLPLAADAPLGLRQTPC